eukprot:234311_1
MKKKLLKSSQWLLYWFYNIFYALLWKKKNIYGISGVGINIYGMSYLYISFFFASWHSIHKYIYIKKPNTETPGDAKVYVTTHTVPGIDRPKESSQIFIQETN